MIPPRAGGPKGPETQRAKMQGGERMRTDKGAREKAEKGYHTERLASIQQIFIES